MANLLSGRYRFQDLAGFAWPTMVFLVFMSMYSMVDGAFVARFVGTDALSAVNIIFPAISGYYAVGIMLATGASAIVARRMGEGAVRLARANFSFMAVVALAAGAALSLAGWFFLERLLTVLGAVTELRGLCREYLATLLPFLPAGLLQVFFQSFFIVAGRPGYGLVLGVLGGVTNIVLDYVFIVTFSMGVGGAALATGIGYSVPAVLGCAYFLFNRRGSLWLTSPRPDGRVLLDSCVNGSSEMITNLSAAVMVYLFNMAMLRHLGVDGVAAMTIVLYSEFLFSAVNYGYSSGVAPLFSYQFGRGAADKLRRLFGNSLLFVGICGVVAVTAAQAFVGRLVPVFAPEGGNVHNYAVHGFRLYSVCFFFMGFNIFASALFTALSNGKVSALLSLSRFFLIVLFITVLPRFVGVDGVWLALPAAEAVALAISACCVRRYRTVYKYF